jgi:hypothetical protein
MSSADYVIAVIGHQGVGKSTVIRRALKAWGMSNPVTVRSPQGFMGELENTPLNIEVEHITESVIVSSCFSHVQPGGKLKHPWKVEFVEMDIRSLDVISVPPAPAWPAIAPCVSGAIVCYDAGHRDTLNGIAPALREYRDLVIPSQRLWPGCIRHVISPGPFANRGPSQIAWPRTASPWSCSHASPTRTVRLTLSRHTATQLASRTTSV